MEKVSQDTESLLKEATTTSKSLITNISNVAKHDEYIKDIKNKKNIKLKYLKDFLSSFHSNNNSSSANSSNKNNHVTSRSESINTEEGLSNKKSDYSQASKDKENLKSNGLSSSKKNRNDSLISSSAISNNTTNMHNKLNSSIDLDYLTKKLESLQKSNSAYNLPLTPINSATNPMIKSSATNPSRISTNPSASTSSSSKSKRLADIYLNDYKLNNKLLSSSKISDVSSGSKKESSRPLSNNLDHHYYNISIKKVSSYNLKLTLI